MKNEFIVNDWKILPIDKKKKIFRKYRIHF